MKKVLFRITASLVTLLFLVIIGLYIFISRLDLNEYKPKLISAIESHNGAKVTIPGNIDFSILPNLAFKVGQMNLQKQSHYSINIGQAKASLALLRLLTKQVELKYIDINKSKLSMQIEKGSLVIEDLNLRLKNAKLNKPFNIDLSGQLKLVQKERNLRMPIKIIGMDLMIDGNSKSKGPIGLKQFQGAFQLKSNKLFYNRLTFQNLSSIIKVKEGVVYITSLDLEGYDGHLAADAKINLLKKSYQAKATIKTLQLEPLLTQMTAKAALSGSLNADLILNSYGETAKQITRNAKGNLGIDLQKGALENYDLDALVNALKKMSSKKKSFAEYLNSGAELLLKRQSFKQGNTPFEFIKTEFKLSQGMAKTDKIKIHTKTLDLSGDGVIDYLNQTVAMKFALAVIEPQPDLKRLLDLLKGGLPILVSGALSEPSIELDYPPVVSALQKLWLPNSKQDLNESIQKIKKVIPDLRKLF